LTGGLSSEFAPAVSPDGSKVLFVQDRSEYSLVSVALDTAAAERVITSELSVGMPAWAMRQEKFVYESKRTGPPEIWLRAEGWDRSVVSPAQFPAGFTNELMNPALSPGADRIAYTRAASDGSVYAWISSVSGGPPVRLTNESKVNEYSGCWSPDAKTFAYLRETNDKIDLAVVRTSGDATPVVIRHGVGERLPEWSPDGQWISVLDQGLMLVSPDGKTVRELGRRGATQFTFSKDSRLLYGLRRRDGRGQLFSLDIETKTEKIIGGFELEFYPASFVTPAVRFSLSPDGKSILYSSVSQKRSLWMLEGFEPPTWTERLREMLPW
jgi:Tol biopolymer transport system component